jgi:bifunctional DNA-binding transcriptional regulator/antitoxin component of YhaV-PrlF toxin-antitoxin module
MSAVVTEDGEISIPRVVREALELGPGTVFEVQSQAGTFVAWKKVEPDVIDKWRGRGQLPVGTGPDDYLRPIRDGDRRCHLRASSVNPRKTSSIGRTETGCHQLRLAGLAMTPG